MMNKNAMAQSHGSAKGLELPAPVKREEATRRAPVAVSPGRKDTKSPGDFSALGAESEVRADQARLQAALSRQMNVISPLTESSKTSWSTARVVRHR